MQDNSDITGTDLSGQDWQGWLDRAEAAVGDDGYMQPLGADHAALFCERKPVLLVTFESFDRLEDISDAGQPFGWTMRDALGWSHLCLLCRGDTWFRDARVYGYFDRLIDDGFFDEFEQVIFYGAGAFGYAAAAFSVAAPGARVVALRPQATLDPRISEWDDRYAEMRRVAFDDRYGYAPDMLDAAEQAFVLYDPEIALDAMHAALFTRANVTRFRERFLGSKFAQALWEMDVLLRILAQASSGKLNRLSLARLFRARRGYLPYLKRVLARLERENRLYLIALWSQAVMREIPGPRSRRAMRNAFAAAEAKGLPMPPREIE